MKILIDEDTTKQALRMEGVPENRLDEAIKYFTGSMMDHRYKALDDAAKHVKGVR